jgi:hypothetical protein
MVNRDHQPFTIHHLPFTRLYGKKIINRESQSQAEIFVARLHSLPSLRPGARIPAQVSLVPYLLPRIGVGRADSRGREIKLVIRQWSVVSCQLLGMKAQLTTDS